jgi:hypothetical protein
MLSRFLDWLDDSAAGVIRLAYLLAGVIAVASYFSDGRVPHGLSDALAGVLPWALAGALEVHTYLSARRVRAAWQDLQAASLGSDEYERAGRSMRVNLWILAGLLAFSMYNQLQYLAQTWTPPHTPLTPPGPLAYLVRAIITPSAFMAAAFLAPIGEGMAAQVQREAHTLARLAFKAAAAQWKRRLREMQQQQQDVTGALVGLIDDPSERRVVAGIWQAMHPGEAVPGFITGDAITPPSPATGSESPYTHAQDAPQLPPVPPRPPTGPGSPSAATARTARQTGTPERPAILRLTPDRPARRAAARGANTRGVRTATVEHQVRAAWRPDMTVGQLERAAGVSRNSAAKWRRVLRAEAEGRAQ